LYAFKEEQFALARDLDIRFQVSRISYRHRQPHRRKYLNQLLQGNETAFSAAMFVVVVVAGCAVGVRWKGNRRVPFRQRLIAMSNMFLLALTSRCHSIPQLLHD
jgi:hypothetical protein